MKMKLGLIILACFIIIVGGTITMKTFAQDESDNTISKGVFIEDIDISELNIEEVQAKVEQYVADMQEKSITLQIGSDSVEIQTNELGLTWENTHLIEDAMNLGKTGNIIKRYKDLKDLENEPKVFEVAYVLDSEKVKAVLEEKANPFCQEAINAQISRGASGFTITPEQEGKTVDVDKSIEILAEYIKNTWDGSNGTVEIAVEVSTPKVLAADLESIQDLLGGHSTNYSTGTGRAKNVETGAARINGSVVYPGEEFSVYEVVSPFNAENGYELAGSYENGTTVQSYGGGICQVSTTLYNAVIRSEMKITERFAHSMIVAYVSPSMDAAIAGTWKDLKFVNNNDTPIYIEGYTGGGQIGFNLYGKDTRPANRTIKFESETLTETQPGTSLVAIDAPIGHFSTEQTAHVGKTAKLWKIVYEDGNEVSREAFNTSNYQASPKIVKVGISSANPEATAAMQAAIGSGNEDACKATAAQWNDAVLAASAAAEAKAKEEEEKAKEEEKAEEEEKEEKKKDNKKDTSSDKDADVEENDDSKEEDN